MEKDQYSPSAVRKLRDRYGFRFSKRLGQHFLTDQNIIDKIISGAEIGNEDLVIEIGPGMGVLTAAAAERAAAVVAVELDRALIPILEDRFKDYANVEIQNGDILKTDIGAIVERCAAAGKSAGRVKLIGNLPYYITTPIIMKVLEDRAPVDSMTFMMQKEVAERIISPAGSKGCGAISAVVQYYCLPVHIANVPREVFVPKPAVDSAVIRFDIRKEKAVPLSEKCFFAVIKAGFGKRRKTLLNSMTGVEGLSREAAAAAIAAAGIDAGRRAETLNLKEFSVLSDAVFTIDFLRN
ncbi:MAG: 16S rRNA (adenine(1518)-N(6)/adenine(1519)-N(6))-dimethyltransferase RsmA [Clostridiales Family XIII bacterium]|jgi:16S rRNA (adenine1518-N6/adenine1519-N6)-dimethyltransferase|nr:16S rRNA (adenine(1518)-N(6)/adenine(1519)-N(6))-dimethyltransferase RsmA [Clostridiales Family XIII bacterium]